MVKTDKITLIFGLFLVWKLQYYLLECNAVQAVRNMSTFQSILLFPSTGQLLHWWRKQWHPMKR